MVVTLIKSNQMEYSFIDNKPDTNASGFIDELGSVKDTND